MEAQRQRRWRAAQLIARVPKVKLSPVFATDNLFTEINWVHRNGALRLSATNDASCAFDCCATGTG